MNPAPDHLLPLLYETATDNDQWLPFLSNLGQQLDARLATLIARDESARCNLVLQTGADPEAQRLYQSYYNEIDVFFYAAQQRGFNIPGSVAPAQAFISDKELRATEYCNDFLLKFGWFQHCFALFGNNGIAETNVSLMRGPHEDAFGHTELDYLRFLGPHIQQALRLGERFRQLRAESEGRKAALDQLSLGVVYVDARGRILGTNAAAEATLSRRDGLSSQGGYLRALQPSENRALSAAIAGTCVNSVGRKNPGGALLITRRSPAKPLQAIVGPVSHGLDVLPAGPAAVVFIHDLSARSRPRADILKDLYGLTPAELRVTFLLLDGLSAEEISELLSVSRNTVKTQIRSIFAKMGVRRQTELVRALMLLPSEGTTPNGQSLRVD